MRTALRRVPVTVATVLSLTLLMTACSGDSDSSGATPGDGSSSATAVDEPPALATTATLGKVTGRLPEAERGTVRTQVATTVDGWFDAAYVGGDWPRSDFAEAWAGFTSGAATDAKGDKRLMCNQDIGAKVSAVVATKRDVTVDVLSVKGKPAGATARFVLRFTTSGDVQRKVVVRGRLFLTPGGDGWQIFGYDVTKGRGA
jgi:hypothetical protein